VKRSVSARTVLVTVLAVAVLSGGASSSVTHAYLSSTVSGSGTVGAAESFGSDSPPDDAVAWNDADGDGQYDEGEQTYSEDDLTGTGGKNIDLSGKSIQSTEPITVQANGNGDIDLSGTRIDAAGSIEIRVRGEGSTLDLTDAELISGESITLTAKGGTIVLDGATCDPEASINGDTSGGSSCA